MKKILIIRLSAIGDIVLTSPVVRNLKLQHPDLELHFLLKTPFQQTYINNPYISKIHFFDKNEKNELLKVLNAENFDFIIDLQRNNTSRKIRMALNKPFQKLHKLNIRKWLWVNLKWNTMPHVHIVDRYLDVAKKFNIYNDNQGLDYFISSEDEKFALDFKASNGKYSAIAIGAAHNTKQIPIEKINQIISQNPSSLFVLLGGKEDIEKAKTIANHNNNCISLAGKCTLNESAGIIKYAENVICGDTGLMHIAAAFQKKIYSLWGNTVPALGMYPYMPKHLENNIIIENKNLDCRPCSKLGKKKCPKGHFKCMKDLDVSIINTL